MGNPKKGKASKAKNQAQRVQISVMSGEIATDSIVVDRTKLLVILESLNYEMVVLSRVSDWITFVWLGNMIEAHVREKYIGTVPTMFNSVLKDHNITHGFIEEIVVGECQKVIVCISL